METVNSESTSESKLRRAIFKRFLCSPRHLERLIARALGCGSLRFKGILGCGGFNLVMDAEMDQRRVAIRLPDPKTHPCLRQVANWKSGYAATLFMSQLHLPVLIARPVLTTLPYIPRNKSQFTVMEVAPGVVLHKVWKKDTPLELKKRVLADLAAVAAQLYRHPVHALGDMAVSADGAPCVGELSTGAVARAIRRGINVGQLSPGPYATWKEYARNQVEGLRLASRMYCPLVYLDAVETNLDLLLRWLDKFNPPAERNERFYLYHPELDMPQIMVDPASGRVESILDWDGAKTGTIHQLVDAFCLLDLIDWGDKDKDELYDFYCTQLVQGGAAELVAYLMQTDDPQVMFDDELAGVSLKCGLQSRLSRLCTRMQRLGLIGPEEKVAPLIQAPLQPWRKFVYDSARDWLQ